MALTEEITLVFDERVGWTTFQTYVPDSGVSLNNRYYTFNGGQIWQHHIETVQRNSFYDDREPSIVEVIFNDNPSDVKNFKTIGYEGEGNWDVIITTDQESTVTDSTTIPVTRSSSGNIVSADFVNRQGKKHAFIRGKSETVTNLSLERITVEGVGQGTVNIDNTTVVVPDVGNAVIGDSLFYFRANTTTPLSFQNNLLLVGVITGINRETNTITYNYTGDTTALPTSNDFFLTSKDNVVEASGVIGFYGIVRFSSNDTNMVELFSINTEVIASAS